MSSARIPPRLRSCKFHIHRTPSRWWSYRRRASAPGSSNLGPPRGLSGAWDGDRRRRSSGWTGGGRRRRRPPARKVSGAGPRARRWKVPWGFLGAARAGRRGEPRGAAAAGAGARVALGSEPAPLGAARAPRESPRRTARIAGGATGFDVAAEAPELTPRPLIMLARSSLPASSAELSTSVSESESSMKTRARAGAASRAGSGDASSSSLSFTSSWDLRTERLFFFRTGCAARSPRRCRSSRRRSPCRLTCRVTTRRDEAQSAKPRRPSPGTRSGRFCPRDGLDASESVTQRRWIRRCDPSARSASSSARRGVFDGRVWFPSDDSEKNGFLDYQSSRENFEGQPSFSGTPAPRRKRDSECRRARARERGDSEFLIDF